ncbi:MAG: IclR family transcriptional regulator [Proteobacteria bacterium]|nr:IclR family transcriptional regulator [Pseudomonadota bacterium]
MTRATDYTNAAQQRLLKVVLALFGDVVNGYAPSALARAVACSPQVITRDLDNLRTAGLAERDEETGHWRLTPRLPQQAVRVWAAIDRAERRVQDTRARISTAAGDGAPLRPRFTPEN